MANYFECPRCGGRIEAVSAEPKIACEYCAALVDVPEELRQAIGEVQAARTIKNARKWVILFIVIVFVVPTCLGVAGSLVGIATPIFALLLSGILALFGN
jgi:hypothetical protein